MKNIDKAIEIYILVFAVILAVMFMFSKFGLEIYATYTLYLLITLVLMFSIILITVVIYLTFLQLYIFIFKTKK